MTNSIINKIIAQIQNKSLALASLPDIIVKVDDAINDDRKGLKDIAEIIQLDAAISSRILQVANSPALRGFKEIASVTDAVTRLGVALIKNLIICFALRDKFVGKRSSSRILTQTLHTNIIRSIYSFIIAKDLGKPFLADVALIVGLISNLGDIIIMRYIDDHDEQDCFTEGEVQELVNRYGKEITKIIVTSWHLPSAIPESIFPIDQINIETPKTYHDIVATAEYFIQNRTNNDDVVVTKVKQVLENYKDDLAILKTIFH